MRGDIGIIAITGRELYAVIPYHKKSLSLSLSVRTFLPMIAGSQGNSCRVIETQRTGVFRDLDLTQHGQLFMPVTRKRSKFMICSHHHLYITNQEL